jgi:hypothetical protein
LFLGFWSLVLRFTEIAGITESRVTQFFLDVFYFGTYFAGERQYSQLNRVGYSQNISGRIVDENNHPVGFASLFIRETSAGTTANDRGEYFLAIDPGVYHIAISSVGYTTTQEEIIVKDKPIV